MALFIINFIIFNTGIRLSKLSLKKHMCNLELQVHILYIS